MAHSGMSDDVLTYVIYSSECLTNESLGSDLLLKLAADSLSKCKEFTSEYIWNRESFFLAPNHSSIDSDEIECLFGRTDVGESIEDEWFIIFLLFHLSKMYPQFVISVTDGDGEVLLIEAAEHLPKWLKPETSKNRVFISNGKVHIIPLPRTPAEVVSLPTGTPDIRKAIKLVSEGTYTEADSTIQRLIQKRIEEYPSKIQSLQHHAYCYIPSNIAYAFSTRPNLIATSVQAFCQRDPLETKMLRNIKHFRPEERVLARISHTHTLMDIIPNHYGRFFRTLMKLDKVRFTKLLYSQVLQQNVVPFPKSGWSLPQQTSPDYRAHSLGFKLVCGFELLCNRCTKTRDSQDAPTGPRWIKYLEYLKKSGYFKGEIEGSRLYMDQLRSAEQYFKCFAENTQNTLRDNTDISTSGLIDLLEEGRRHVDRIKEESTHLLPEDDDSWLHLSPEDLERMMLDVWGQRNDTSDAREHYEERLDALVGGVKNFVDKVSSHEGAETGSSYSHDPIAFDGEKFMGALQRMMGNPEVNTAADHILLNSDPDSESDYGEEDDEEFTTCKEDLADLDPMMAKVYDSMAKELKDSNVQKSFETLGIGKGSSHDNQEKDEDMEPLDIDVNLVNNFLESFSSQEGLSGPVSSMLQSLGMTLPPNQTGNSNS